MIVVNDTIIGYGMAQADTIDYQQGVILVKIDSSGNLIKSNVIVDTTGDLLSIDKYWGKITASSEGGYAFTTAPFVKNSAWLVKVDDDLELEFIHEYPDTVNASNFMYSILEIEDGYILYGGIQDPDLTLRSFIKKVDKNGEIIWTKFYGNPNFWGVITDVELVNDAIFIVSSNEWLSADIIFGSTQTVLYYIDMEGEVVESWVSGPNPNVGLIYKILPMPNGGFIGFGESTVGHSPISGHPIVQSTFSRMDPEFNLEWVSKFGRIGKYTADYTFYDMEFMLDGNIIAAGESITEMDGNKYASGWLMKLSPEGDSIWSRYDLPPFSPHDPFNDQFFGGVGVLSSGSIIAGGQANDHGKRYIWLVKVTSDGCLDTLYCGLVVPTSTVEAQGKTGGMVVYPNPASSSVTIELVKGIRSGGEVLFFNAQGKEVLRKVLPAQHKTYTFSISSLPVGLYYIEARDNGQGTVQQGKLIVIH